MSSQEQPLKKRCRLHFDIVPTKMQGSTEKKYKQKTVKRIMEAINALLNTEGGGLLELTFERNPPKKHLENVLKLIEQKVIDLIGITTVVSAVKSKIGEQKIVVDVHSDGCQLWTVSYNLHLPVMSQVVTVPSNEPLEKIQQLIEGNERQFDYLTTILDKIYWQTSAF